MDIYLYLDYKLIDTTSELMKDYNVVYQPFNVIEGIIWFAYIPKTFIKYYGKTNNQNVFLQCFSFMLFGISDFIEVNATTPLLLLFKLSVIIALITGHRSIINNLKSAQSGPRE